MQKFGSQVEFKTTANLTHRETSNRLLEHFFVYLNEIFKSYFIFKHSKIAP